MIASIAPHTIAFSRAATAAAELFTLIDRKSQLNPFNEEGDRPSSVEGSINMRGVTFCYPSRPEVAVLRDFSLHIPAGKVTALVVSCVKGSILSSFANIIQRGQAVLAKVQSSDCSRDGIA
jgi:ATP-binding cassette subfamily B (MDR/TAP) protein 1